MNSKQFNEEMVKCTHSESENYRKLSGTLLRAESITKIRRYGVDAYHKTFIQNPDKAFSSYMNTFLYLRDMEASHKYIRDIYRLK